METAEIFRSPQVECPHCGEIINLDESQINQEVDCDTCGKSFKTME